RHTRFSRDWSSDVCSSDLLQGQPVDIAWQDGKLHVLHKRDIQLILTVISGLGSDDVHWTSTVLTEMGVGGDLDELSMYVESGQRSEERRVGKGCGSRGAG